MEKPAETAGDLTQKNYKLVCRTKRYMNYKTEVVNGRELNYNREMSLLVLEYNDQAVQFLNAWLPDQVSETGSDNYYEVGIFVRGRVMSPARAAMFRGPDKRSDKHYLLTMSKGVEELLVKLKDGSRIEVDVLAESDDDELDQMKDSDGSYELIDGHTDLKGN